MSLSVENPVTVSIADGATASFPTVFTFEQASEVKVYVEIAGAQALKVAGSDYDIVGASPDTAGADVVFRAGHVPPAAAKVLRVRGTPASQPDHMGTAGQISPAQLEAAADRAVRLEQEILSAVSRALKVPLGELAPDLAGTSLRAGKILAFDDAGEARWDLTVSALGDASAATAEALAAKDAAVAAAGAASTDADQVALDRAQADSDSAAAVAAATAAATSAGAAAAALAAALTKAANGSDIPDKAAFRAALLLGASALLGVITDPSLGGATDAVVASAAATKAYIDAHVAGFHYLDPVDCATTANIILSGEQAIDGFNTAASRVLVKNQTDAKQNRIYRSAAGAWAVESDDDASAEIFLSAVFVKNGTTQKNTQWGNSNATTPAVGVDNITYRQVGGAASYSPGLGLLLAGTVFSPDFGTTVNKVARGDDARFVAGPYKVASYAALRATPPTTPAVALVLGRAAANDGGQGLFVLDAADSSTADNGGTVLVDGAGGRWKRAYDGPAHLLWWDADPTGAADSRPAFTAALAANPWVSLPPRKTFKLASRLTLPSLTRLHGNFSKVVSAAGLADHLLVIADNASDIFVEKLEIDGNKANVPAGNSGLTTGATSCSNVRLEDIYVHDCSAHGIGLVATNSSKVFIARCRAENNTLTGIGVGNTVTDAVITHCFAAGNSGCGIGLGIGLHVAISNCVSRDNGPNGDNFTGYDYRNNDVALSNLVSIGGNNNGVHFGGNNVSYSNIAIRNPAQYGLVHESSNGVSQFPTRNVSATGIVIYWDGTVAGSGAHAGCWFDQVTDLAVSGYSCIGSLSHGFYAYGCLRGALTGIVCHGNGGDGVNLESCTAVTLTGWQAYNNPNRDGVQLLNCTDCQIGIGFAKSNGSYGYRELGTSGNNFLQGFTCRSNGGGDVAAVGAGTRWSELNLTQTMAAAGVAAAATLNIPANSPGRSRIYVTGTTQISALTAMWPGAEVQLCFDGALTVKNGTGNLRLNGADFATHYRSTLRLIQDPSGFSTDFFEVARAFN
jgi:hypothetical protein